MKATSVSVVLLAHHGDRWLPGCLDSLVGATRRRLHLILVDNGGNHRLDRLDLRSFEVERIITPRPMGFAEANNYALTHADRLEEIVIFLNQDTRSCTGWMDRAVQALEEDPGLGAVSPLIRTYDDEGWDPGCQACIETVHNGRVDEITSEAKVVHTDSVPATALLISRRVLARVGPFDPIFGSYYEDYDLCRRVREEGYRVGFVSEATILHFSGSTSFGLGRERQRSRRILRNRLIHEVRSARNRRRVLVRYALLDVPRRLARGILGTPSSQHPAITLAAQGDLIRVLPRLVSMDRDETLWKRYLHEIGWPPASATDSESALTPGGS